MITRTVSDKDPQRPLSAGSSVYSSHIPFLGVATSHYAHPSSSPALATLAWSPPFSEAWRLGHSRMLLPYSPRPEGSLESPLGT